VVQRSIENSLCFGVYLHEKQIGFARVVTDFATFGYLADVFILPEQRSKGLSKWMMQLIIDHPQLQGLRRFTLATRDAHNYMLNLDLLRLISLNDGCNDTIPMSIRMRFSTQADFPILNRKLQAVFMMIK
jgi:GNAT superfamily N-acetyltransferase